MSRLEQFDNSSVIAEDYQAPTGEVVVESFTLTKGHWALLAVALLSILFIIFITIARSIQISAMTVNLTKPEQMLPISAEVSLDRLIKLPLGNRVLVLPGQLKIVAQAEGYQELTQDFVIGSGRNQEFELILQPTPGEIDIQLSPEIGAKVLLDGEPFGDLPGLMQGVAAGQHEIIVDAPLYRAVTRSVLVQGKGEREALSITLDPAWGNLSIDSEPNVVNVLIDNEMVGQTPLQIKVEEGSHTLSLVAEKFKTFSQDFTMIAQQDLQVPAIKLIPADGILEVATNPTEAAVILNGEYLGISPLTLRLKPDQSQQVQFYKSGFRVRTEQITLAPGQQEKQQIALSQDIASVRFSVSPASAELYIDGVRRGQGSQTISLNTLPHKISVRKAGYVSFHSEIIPTKSSSQVVSVKLLTKAEHFWANVPDRYETVVGNKMKLFKSPGMVKLGSSRRETGRRSNEVVHTAELKQHFYVSLHEVTNKQFRKFQPTHSSGNYKRKSLDPNKHPVVNVSWQQAALFCNWLSKKEKLSPFYQTKSGFVAGNNVGANGYRLLTETEWAWLARNKGNQVLNYPWGKSATGIGNAPIGNYADKSAVEYIAFTLANYNDNYKASAPIGRFPANHRGLFDIGGNVAEWVNDWYGSNAEYSSGDQKPLVDPLGPDEGEFHVIRGASWARGHLPQLRLAYRDFGAKGVHDVGFRIARYVGAPQ